MKRILSFLITVSVFLFGFLNEAFPKPKPTVDKSITSGKMSDITHDPKFKWENLESDRPMEDLEKVEEVSGDEDFLPETGELEREVTDKSRLETKRNLEREATKKRWKD